MPYNLVLWVCFLPTASAVIIPASQEPPADVLAKGQTVILGTWNWKIEGNQFGHQTQADFWWQQVDQKTRFLVPRGGAGCRELHDVSFPEAKHLSPGWIQFARQRPNVKEYHLEVIWVLYKAK